MDPAGPQKPTDSRQRQFQTLKASALFATFMAVLVFLALFVKENDLLRLTHPQIPQPEQIPTVTDRAPASPTRRPLIIYTKAHKTGSTFVSSTLSMTVMRAGGRVAPCPLFSQITPLSQYYGLLHRYDLLCCHFDLLSVNMPALVNTAREVVFVTTIREPISWFLSAAVQAYQVDNHLMVESKQLLHAAIDSALDAKKSRFKVIHRKFLATYGLNSSSQERDIVAAASRYAYIFDHSSAEKDLHRALVELGYTPSPPSVLRYGAHKFDWFQGYRKDEIVNATRIQAALYETFRKTRSSHLVKGLPFVNMKAGDKPEIRDRTKFNRNKSR